MSKISITNGNITGLTAYGNGVLIETTPDAVVIVNGLPAATAADIQQAMSVEVVNDKPVGPRDLFTRPWRQGDRNPTEAEQTFKREWFLEYGKNQPAPQTTGQPAGVTEIPFVNGGKFSLPYPAADQRRWILTNVTSGMCALNLGKIAQGRHPGVARISIVAESSGDCTTEIAFATEAGVFVGDNVIEAFPRHPEQSLNFQVGQNVAGNGPRVSSDKETIVNVRFFGTPASRVLVEIAAHDQVK